MAIIRYTKDVLQKEGKYVGKEYNDVIGYFGSLGSAVKRYISRQIAENEDTVTIKEFLEIYENIVDKVVEYLETKEVNV